MLIIATTKTKGEGGLIMAMSVSKVPLNIIKNNPLSASRASGTAANHVPARQPSSADESAFQSHDISSNVKQIKD